MKIFILTTGRWTNIDKLNVIAVLDFWDFRVLQKIIQLHEKFKQTNDTRMMIEIKRPRAREIDSFGREDINS